jgi:myo-inositol-1(or 4)-monophosphatase
MDSGKKIMNIESLNIPSDAPSEHADALGSALRAAAAAGKVLMDLYNQPHDIRYKGAIDLVTEADVASENAIKSIIIAESKAEIMAEESADSIECPNAPVWIIDPLDGTTNYAHGFPFFCISICYYLGAPSEGHRPGPVAGVIYCPVLDEMFAALRGCGAWLNSNPIKTTSEQELNRGLMATGFPYTIRDESRWVLEALQHVIVQAQGIRRAGAAALDLAWLAAGRVDGFWEAGLKPWDTAAGQLLVSEAGGNITDFSGRDYNPFMKEILASNGPLHQQLVTILKEFHGKKA